jgi:flagellar biosynthesis protein FlhG
VNNLPGRQRLAAEPRLIAIGGGGGGTGRSTFAAELARALARRGRTVLVVDADVSAPTQHARLGMEVPEAITGVPLGDTTRLDSLIIPGAAGRPSVLPLGLAARPALSPPPLSPAPLVSSLRTLGFDDIIIDLPAAPGALWSTVFVLSDVPVLLGPTESTALHTMVRYLQSALLAAVRSRPEAAGVLAEIDRTIAALPGDPSRTVLDEAFEMAGLGDVLNAARERLEAYLVLSMTREPAERDLGHALALSFERLVGVWPRYVGALGHDDRRWFHLRHEPRAGALADAAGEGLCDDVVKALSDLEAFDAEQPRRPAYRRLEPWFRIGIAPTSDPQAARLAARRLWEGLRRESPLTAVVLPRALREQMIADVEEATRELGTALSESGAMSGVSARATPRRPGSSPGARIRDVRTSRTLSQRDLSLQTKIGLSTLEAIERFEIDALPRAAYLRGYLREIAIALGLDPEALMDEYLTAVSEAHNAPILRRQDPDRS